jgi:hypothetical protein
MNRKFPIRPVQGTLQMEYIRNKAVVTSTGKERKPSTDYGPHLLTDVKEMSGGGRGSHSSEYKQLYRFNTVQSGESQPTFRNDSSHLSSGLKRKPSIFLLISCLAKVSAMKTEAVCSFETFVGFCRNTTSLHPTRYGS